MQPDPARSCTRLRRTLDNGFSADMYWRVQNFQDNIGVVPVSAETSEGFLTC